MGNDIEIPNTEIGVGGKHAQIYYNISKHVMEVIRDII